MLKAAAKSTKLIVILAVLSTISLTGIIAWFTGLIDLLVTKISALWDDAIIWLNSAEGWDAIIVAVAPILIVVVILCALFAVMSQL